MDSIDADWQLVDTHASSRPAVPGLLRLPPELRTQIYTLVLGGHVVSYPYPRPSPPRPASLSHASAKRYAISREGQLVQQPPAPAPARTHRHLLALLLTCQALYAEALPTLYDANTFHIQTPRLFSELDANVATAHLSRVKALRLSTADLPAAAAFLRAVPAPVLARITRLRLDCCGSPGSNSRAHIPHGFQWREVWAIVRSMRGLHELRVWVCGSKVPLGWERTVLAPLREVTHVPDFCVYVPWSQESVDAHRGSDVPFRLETYGLDGS